MTIGSRIKELLKARGMTQRQLAKDANVSVSYLAGIESDKYKPSIKTLARIANALNVAIEELTTGGNNNEQ